MEINLTAHEMAIHIDRTRLSTQAARGWITEQAASVLPRRSVSFAVRQWAGATLILAGGRIQGTTAPVLAAINAEPHPASIQDA